MACLPGLKRPSLIVKPGGSKVIEKAVSTLPGQGRAERIAVAAGFDCFTRDPKPEALKAHPGHHLMFFRSE